MILEELVEEIVLHSREVVELNEKKYKEFLKATVTHRFEPIMMGDNTGYDANKGCFMFGGCEIRKAA
jgi:hypothetical protein